MSASRDWTGDSNSRHHMDPRARAEALCDELRSGARPPHTALTFCICKELAAMLRAATGQHKRSPALRAQRTHAARRGR